MKTAYLNFLFLLCWHSGHAQNWQWATSANETPSIEAIGKSVCTDVYGNVIVTGYFSTSITFDSIVLTGGGGCCFHFFVAKYNSAGRVLWAKKSSGSWVLGNSVCTDKEGNIYITGECLDSSVSFDTVSAGSTGSDNVLVVKYDPAGNALWARVSGIPSGSGYDVGRTITCDISGNVIITGWFEGPSIKFGAYTLYTPPGYSYNGFVVKYDPDGNVLWAKNTGTSQMAFGFSLSTDAAQNIYVAGMYNNTISFGSTVLINHDTAAVSDDIFLVKYDAAGNFLWVRNIGGTAQEAGYSIATDVANNVYMTGSFESDSIAFGSSVFHNVGFSDVFIVKYDPLGNVIWAKTAGGAGRDEGYSICTNSHENVYVSGWFNEATNIFDTTLAATPGLSVFTAKFDPAGDLLCTSSLACNGYHQTGSIATDYLDNAYLTGAYNTTFAVGSDSLYGRGLYLIKYDCSDTLNIGIANSTVPETRIFPNPSSGRITIEPGAGIESIRIYDTLGNSLLSSKTNNERQEIDLGTYSRGIYFIELSGANDRRVKKIILQ
ncbi:MAG: hypothetical protein JWO09_372 [Bacteroidetes bacterium]|nr:hypothetical protein [Bacteroidota bacterium]